MCAYQNIQSACQQPIRRHFTNVSHHAGRTLWCKQKVYSNNNWTMKQSRDDNGKSLVSRLLVLLTTVKRKTAREPGLAAHTGWVGVPDGPVTKTCDYTHAQLGVQGESVAQSKSTHSQKPKLSMTECSHQMDWWPLGAKLCACPEISPESNSTKVLQIRL